MRGGLPDADGGVQDGDAQSSAALRTFKRGSEASYLCAVYNAGRDSAGRTRLESEVRFIAKVSRSIAASYVRSRQRLTASHHRRRHVALRRHVSSGQLRVGDDRVRSSGEEPWPSHAEGGLRGCRRLIPTRALRLHRPLRGWHALHRVCARPARARTGAQQRPWREVHGGPASGAAGVSGGVSIGGEGAGARVRGEALDSSTEGRVGRPAAVTRAVRGDEQARSLAPVGEPRRRQDGAERLLGRESLD